MPRNQDTVREAVRRQQAAAYEVGRRIRLIAGPGTGKSHALCRRVGYLLGNGVPPPSIAVISFTRASARDLSRRIRELAAQEGFDATGVSVTTMHSLALGLLLQAGLLREYPARPRVLDDWEEENIFDAEFSAMAHCTPSRAADVRRAHDAHWQTLQPLDLFGAPYLSEAEQQAFSAFHESAKRTYNCVLRGEVVRECVDRINVGALNVRELSEVRHLIVDEYQDLNKCDQDFVSLVVADGESLLIAGDDDQSIYAFRHAFPDGIRQFEMNYTGASTHRLEHCVRCTPSIATAASMLIARNPGRIAKTLSSAYASVTPPVDGLFKVLRQSTGTTEAAAISQSCRDLIDAGLNPSEIMILLINSRVQLPLIRQAMDATKVPYDEPRGVPLHDLPVHRFVYALLRIARDTDDYVAHRTILGLLSGVGVGTCLTIARAAADAHLNFRDLFYKPYPPDVFRGRAIAAVRRATEIIAQVPAFDGARAVADCLTIMGTAIEQAFGPDRNQSSPTPRQEWEAFATSLPDGMLMEELYQYYSADSDAERVRVVEDVRQRVGTGSSVLGAVAGGGRQGRVRILTMHGAKGLDSCVVFIPGLEEGILPSVRDVRSAGDLEERRRLLYVSITRAKAACILSLAKERSGAQSRTIDQRPVTRLPASRFLREIGVPIVDRRGGLTPSEVAQIIGDCSNL